MLVLSRKASQSFVLGDTIEITVIEISGDRVKIAIDAPKDVQILRKELIEVKQTNLESAAGSFDPAQLSKLKKTFQSVRKDAPAAPATPPDEQPEE